MSSSRIGKRKTSAEARAPAPEKSADRRTGRKQLAERTPIVNAVIPSYTLSEAVDFVMKVKRANNLKEKTLDGYVQNMRYLNEWLTERYGDIRIAEVTSVMLRDYVIWCAEEKPFYVGHRYKSNYAKERVGISAASVNVRIRVLRTFFTVLYEEDIIERNPTATLSLMRQDIDTVLPLTEDELKRLLRAPDQKYYAQFRDYVIMVLIIDTGMRLNEICSLEITEIDFVKKLITLPASKNKNRKSRILPLSTETARLLNQLISETAQHFDTIYAFNTNYGEQLADKTVQKGITRLAETAKIGRSVSPHVLRHNFASMAAEGGMSVFHLQKLMGHADIGTTRKYVQLSEESITDQHTRFSPLGRILKR